MRPYDPQQTVRFFDNLNTCAAYSGRSPVTRRLAEAASQARPAMRLNGVDMGEPHI